MTQPDPSRALPGRGASKLPARLPARERLLLAVAEGLPALDPAELSVQAICTRAGVRPPTLYHHFGSKDGLVAAAVDSLAASWLDLLDLSVDRTGSVEVALDQAQDAWFAMITAPQRPFAVFVWVSLWSEAARPALVSARTRAERFIEDFLVNSLGVAHDAPDRSRLVMDGLLGASIDYQMDADPLALRRRLATLVGSVEVWVDPAPGAPGTSPASTGPRAPDQPAGAPTHTPPSAHPSPPNVGTPPTDPR